MAPKFEVDPWWPKPLPEGWVTGQLATVVVDDNDFVIVTNRRDISEEEQETCVQAGSVIIFDPEGNVVDSQGMRATVPIKIHSCCVDKDDNIWLNGNGDGIVQKYTRNGELLFQLGESGKFDSSDGTAEGEALNSGKNQFYKTTGMTADPDNGDIYVCDGYGNRRVVVLERWELLAPVGEARIHRGNQ